MNNMLVSVALLIVIFPLVGSLIAGLLGKRLGCFLTHRITVSLVGVAFCLSLYLVKIILLDGAVGVDHIFYTWATAGTLHFDVAFLIDRLSVSMVCVVLFVSFMVHIYSIGYMANDPGYQRFFSYVSLFTFAMLVLVLADNLLLLFLGWEGVGLVSYLLIGFWFERESANAGSLKAFLVNRIGDIGFVLAMAATLKFFGSLHYSEVFSGVSAAQNLTVTIFANYSVSAIGLIAFLLFVGAMAKSAQIPLHVWLPESMEGPTPISALIHAATMVTAGIYMVARMSPLFEYAEGTLSLILIIGGTTALFMGILAVVQFDIKRVIAYSTLSQLGYMTVALGASAYNAAMFHLITHAFFKALLFLAAGSVIIALHHEQDMRKMGGLAIYLPITYFTFLIGALALSAVPPFSGFYSKDMIIDAVQLSTLPGAKYAYFCVLAGAFLTPLYIFRALFMTFHTQERMDAHVKSHLHESPWVICLPLVALAIPSVIAGQMLIQWMLFSPDTLLGASIFVLPQHNVLSEIAKEYHGANQLALKAGETLTFWLAIAGLLTAWLFTVVFPGWSEKLKRQFAVLYQILLHQYGFNQFNQIVLVDGTKEAGHLCYDIGDRKLIDGVCVNGSGRLIQWFAKTAKKVQTGYLYHYALSMVLGILVFLSWYMGGF